MTEFTWRDGERTIVFGRGALARAGELLGDGYVLLTTERAQASAPSVAGGAAEILVVDGGRVDELAAGLLERLPDGDAMLVALGGGRVIDTTKALGAATRRSVGAIPTTLSAAEMTAVHRLVPGHEHRGNVRPVLVINDPELCASQPPSELAASAANSLAHAIDGSVTTLASPVPRAAALEATTLTAHAYPAEGGEPDRDGLALAALLSGYTIGSAWYGLHHVLAQTLVRVGGAGHGPANAALLPHTAAALRERSPAQLDRLDSAAGEPVELLAARLAERAGAAGIRHIGVEESRLDACADAAATRGELANTPPVPSAPELRQLYDAAW